jgi:hypothetical protein
VTGQKKLQIPWGKLAKEPSKWLKKKSYPQDFQWRDPSKIKVDDLFTLIAHWRARVSRGRKTLVWVKSSPFFKGVQGTSRQARVFRQRSPVVRESSQEFFDIPSFSNVKEDDESPEEEEENESPDEEEENESPDEEEENESPEEGSNLGSDADVDTGEESGDDQDEDEGLGGDTTDHATDEDISQRPGEHCICAILPSLHKVIHHSLGSSDIYQRSQHSDSRVSNVYASPTSGENHLHPYIDHL